MQDAWEANQEALKELSEHKKMRGLNPKLSVLDEAVVNESMLERLEATAKPIEMSSAPKVHYQYYEPHTGGLPAVICTCGWKKSHLRFKVLEQASLRHFNKTGHNTKP